MPHYTRSFTVDELLQLVADGHIAVPDFQRDFVWEPSRVAELIDSVSRDWPIGAILLLEGPQPFSVRPISEGPNVDWDSVRYFLLDGQQRITALFQALTDRGETVYYCDLDQAGDDELPPVKWGRRDKVRGLNEGARYSLRTLRSADSFDEHLESVSSDVAEQYRTARRERLGPLLSGGYEIPSTTMDSEIGLDALTRIFETLNRTGVKLDAFDLMVAALRRDDFLLRERWEEAKVELKDLERFKVSGIEILKLIALWQRRQDRGNLLKPSGRKVKGIRQRDVLNLEPEFVVESWSRAVGAYANALDYMQRKLGVRGFADVASWAMVLTLAHSIDDGQDDASIRTWYWDAIATQSYAQGANTRVLMDLENPGNYDPAVARGALESSLLDGAPRNRILRLGLRGFLRNLNSRDVIDGKSLEGELSEISVLEASRGRLGTARTDRLVDLALVRTDSLVEGKKALRGSKASSIALDNPALQTQGFTAGLFGEFDELERVAFIVTEFGARP